MLKKVFLFIIFSFALFTKSWTQDFLSLSPSEYAITSSDIPKFYHTVNIPATKEFTKFQVKLLYPEYERLNATEIKLLKRQDYTPPTNISIERHLSFNKREASLTVSFSPFIQKEGRWLRLTSCKLLVTPIKTVSSQSFRSPTVLSSTRNASRYTEQSVLSSGKWVKIRVEKEGIYQITSAQLSAMGFSDISRVKLYGYGGQILPQVFTFTGENSLIDDLQEIPLFRRSGSLLFFSEGVITWTWQTNKWTHENNPYSSYAHYFLTEGNSPAVFPTTEAITDATKHISSVTSRVLYEKDSYSWFNGGREFVDSYNFAFGNKQNYSLNTPGIITNTPAIVEVAFTASDPSNSTVLNVQLNNNSLGSMTLGSYGENESAKWGVRGYETTSLENNNTVTLTSTSGRAARLDYIRISYQRALSATDYGYSFTPNTSETTAIQVANANSNTRVWRLGNGNSTVAEVPGSLAATTYTASTNTPQRKFVIVDIGATYPSPTVVGQVANQNLHADTATDMIILLPPSAKFQAQAERIARVHQTEGLRVRIVNAGEIYNEFSSGTPDAMAYRRYLKMLFDRAESINDMPKFLLLFGPSLWDNRHVTSHTQNLSLEDYLLAYENNSSSSSSYLTLGTLNSYVSDDIYGLLDDSEGQNPTTELLDLAIGRMPVTTLAQAQTMVDKTLAHIQNKETGIWKNTISILGDDGDNNLHMTGAESIAQQIHATTDSLFIIKKFYWDAYKRSSTATGNTFPEVTKLIQDQMNKGSLIFNYMGHGSPYQISHSQLLFTPDFANHVSAGAPFWIFASCEITPYDQIEDDLGRTSLFHPNGSVALLCASRAVYASSNTALNVAFVKHLFTPGNTIGEAIRLAKVEIVRNGSDRSVNKMKYVLLGDPALQLRYPQKGIIIDSINGKHISSFSTQQISAGSVLRISGHIEKNNTIATDFNGVLTGTLFDRDQLVTCVNNSGAQTAMQYKDRGAAIYQGTDSVRNGLFTLHTIVPRNISYTNDPGRIFLYAINSERSEEYNGTNSQFYFNGTNSTLLDTIGPKIFIYLNSPNFPNGGRVNSSFLFGATINDNFGISASGSMGHNMELILDGNYANGITLNDYFSYDFGSYQSGTIAYDFRNLPQGKHSLMFRAWDVNDNSSVAHLDFYVGNVAEYDIQATNDIAKATTSFIVSYPTDDEISEIVLDIYDTAGKLVWKKSLSSINKGYTSIKWDLNSFDTAPLPSGVYIYKAYITSTNSIHETASKKIIIVKQ